MIKILVKFIIDSDGESPRQIVERLSPLGGVPVVGEYDIEIPLLENERLFPKLEAIHKALRGSGAFYSVYTGIGTGDSEPRLVSSEQKVAEMKKKMYAAKLARWREMGVDTKPLEELLEKDLEKFKEVSMTYLKEHLDKAQVVRDVHQSMRLNDEAVYAAVDDLGVTLQNLCKLTELSEHEVVLSLARLISMGKVTRVPKEDKEVYVRVRRTRTLKINGESIPAESIDEAISRVKEAIHHSGSTFRQICRVSKLPEGQAMNALSEILRKGELKSVRKGKNTVYIPVSAHGSS